MKAAAALCGVALACLPARTARAQPAPIAPPRLAVDSPAAYPDQAVRDHVAIAVTVTLVLAIAADGTVTDATVEAPQGHGFDAAALAAARKLRFAPATRDGKPIAARIEFRYKFAPPAPRLGGRVTDTDGTPIANAAILVHLADGRDAATTSAADGTWHADRVVAGAATIDVVADGFEPQSYREVLRPAEDATVAMYLAAAPASSGSGLPEEVIEVKGHVEKPPREVTKRSLSEDEIAEIPGTNGDALKSLLNLPGVGRPPLISGALIVRGSAPSDTSVLIDQVKVPLAFHFGGLSSVIPTELVETIDFSPGNYSAAYGRGMGGIAEVGIRAPRTDGYHALAQLDFIDAHAIVEGPIAGGWSFLAAARQSYFNLWLTPILSRVNDSVSTAPRYTDYQAEIARDFSATSSLRVLLFGATDGIDLTTADGSRAIDEGFWRVVARYQAGLGAHGKLVATAAYGNDTLNADLGAGYTDVTSHRLTARVEVSETIAKGVKANAGIDLAYAPYTIALRKAAPVAPGEPAGSPDAPPVDTNSTGTTFQPAVYTEWELAPWRGATIVPGVRLDYDYGTASWDASPRLAMRQQFGDEGAHTTLKGGVGMFYEPPDPAQIDVGFGSVAVGAQALTGAAKVVPAHALEYDLGIERELTPKIDLSVDLFYKSLAHLLVAGEGSTGDGYAYGTEMMLRYRQGQHFFGWISYTYARSFRRDLASTPRYPFQYDQPNVLAIIASYRWRRWQLGARYRLVSGDPYTAEIGGAYDAAGAQTLPVEGPLNGMRLPVFQALDVRVDHIWQFKRWKLVGYVDIANVTNAPDPEGMTYNYNFTQSQLANGLPILPSIGVRGEL